MPGEDRRIMEHERWIKLEKHMTEQTIHGKYTADRLESIENSLGGTNVLELRQTVSDHSKTISKGKGIAAVLSFIWTALIGWLLSK